MAQNVETCRKEQPLIQFETEVALNRTEQAPDGLRPLPRPTEKDEDSDNGDEDICPESDEMRDSTKKVTYDVQLEEVVHFTPEEEEQREDEISTPTEDDTLKTNPFHGNNFTPTPTELDGKFGGKEGNLPEDFVSYIKIFGLNLLLYFSCLC